MNQPMLPRERCEFSAIVDRPPLKLPGINRVVIWTIVNYEVWDIGKPMARQVLPAPTGAPQLPDVPNWSWHEYGMRVGCWRFFDLYRQARNTADAFGQRAGLRRLSARRGRGARSRLGGHGTCLRAGTGPQGDGPESDDPSQHGPAGAIHRQAAGRLARARPDADPGDAGAVGRGRREIYRGLGL